MTTLDIGNFAREILQLANRVELSKDHQPVAYHERFDDAVVDILIRKSLTIILTYDYDKTTEHENLLAIVEDIKKKINDSLSGLLYLFRDQCGSSVLEFVGSFPLGNVLMMLKKVMEMKYCHAYSFTTHKIIQFVHTDQALKHEVISEPPGYASRYSAWLRNPHAANQHENKMFLAFKETDVWEKWGPLGLFKGLNAVRQEIRSKEYVWAHAFCYSSNMIVNFHYLNGKLSQQRKVANGYYLMRVEPWVRKLEEEEESESDDPLEFVVPSYDPLESPRELEQFIESVGSLLPLESSEPIESIEELEKLASSEPIAALEPIKPQEPKPRPNIATSNVFDTLAEEDPM